MTRERFFEAIGTMQAVFGHTLPLPTLEVYWQRFRDEDDGLFRLAARRLIDTFRPTAQVPFPLPAHILEAMGLGGDAAARQAIALVKHVIGVEGYNHSVSFCDRALHQTIRNYGGWATVCKWSDHDWQINEGRFLESYKAARQTGSDGPEYLPGWTEIDNAPRGYEDVIRPVAVYDGPQYAATGVISRVHIKRAQLGAPAGQAQIEQRGESEPGRLCDVLTGITGTKEEGSNGRN